MTGKTANLDYLAAINARWQASRAQTDAPGFAADVEYLTNRLEAAERAAMAGANYFQVAETHLVDSFARTCTADVRGQLRAAMVDWWGSKGV